MVEDPAFVGQCAGHYLESGCRGHASPFGLRAFSEATLLLHICEFTHSLCGRTS